MLGLLGICLAECIIYDEKQYAGIEMKQDYYLDSHHMMFLVGMVVFAFFLQSTRYITGDGDVGIIDIIILGFVTIPFSLLYFWTRDEELEEGVL